MAVILSIQIFAQKILDLNTLKFNTGKWETIPTRDVEETNDGLIVTYRFSKVLVQQDELYNEASCVKIDGFWLNNRKGEPAILSRWDTFIVPSTDAKVVMIDSIYTDYHLELAAARPILENSSKDSYTRDNVRPISPYSGFFPKKIIPSSRSCKYREQPLFEICVCPLQYNYVGKTVRLYKEIKYKIVFNTSSSYKSKPKPLWSKGLLGSSFLRNIAVNGPSFCQTDTITRNSATLLTNSHYLIITCPKYEPAVNRFAEWKRRLGYNVHIFTQTIWDTITVKDTIRSAYNDYGIEHLLIFGGHNDVPGIIRDKVFNSKHHIHPTDLYYGCLDDGYSPSIFRGRLLVNTLAEANVVVDKIINYEKNPVMDTAFYKKGIHCAYFQDYVYDNNNNVLPLPGDGFEDRRFTYTSERILDRVEDLNKKIDRIYYTESYQEPTHWNLGTYANGSEIPTYLKKPSFAWNGSNNDITYKINQKAFYIFMRDHGGVNGWWQPSYTTTDINSLNNGNYLPVVFSICCLTGKYDESNCFCETFLKKPNGGCVAIFGATQSSLSGANDVMAEGMFDAIWPSSSLWPTFGIVNNPSYSPTPTPTYRLGQILDQGLKRTDEAYSGTVKDWYPQYTSELFHCYGDPSMQIYTEIPTIFSSASISRTNNNIVVNTGGEYAKISFYNKSTGEISSFEGNYVNYSASTPEDITVCISANNKVPYISEVPASYIQNQTINNSTEVNADYIKVGSNVIYNQTSGPVTVNSGTLILNGGSVEIQGETTIKISATLEINN